MCVSVCMCTRVSACVVHSPSRVQLFETQWTAARQAPLSLTTSQSLPKFMSIELVMPSNHLTVCHPLFLPSIFPSIGVFFQWVGYSLQMAQSTGASASVLPMNIQDWFPLGLTGFILQSTGLSRVFSNTTVEKHEFFGTHPYLCSNSYIHTWLLEKP